MLFCCAAFPPPCCPPMPACSSSPFSSSSRSPSFPPAPFKFSNIPRAKLCSRCSPRSVASKPVHSTKVRVRSPWIYSSSPSQSVHSSNP
eukprot:7265750-Pyramimonas_sp.AAC.1